MCHAIKVSQSDFTGNYLHVAIRGKTRRKQNVTLAGMSAKSSRLYPFNQRYFCKFHLTVAAVSLFNPSRNKEFQGKIVKKADQQ